MSRYIDAEPWESMGASVKFEYPNKCDDTLIGHIMLRDIHTADVAPVVHAQWDDSGRYTFPGGSTAVSCTNCSCKLTVSEFRLNKWNYCPNCGAKMDGSEICETN